MYTTKLVVKTKNADELDVIARITTHPAGSECARMYGRIASLMFSEGSSVAQYDEAIVLLDKCQMYVVGDEHAIKVMIERNTMEDQLTVAEHIVYNWLLKVAAHLHPRGLVLKKRYLRQSRKRQHEPERISVLAGQPVKQDGGNAMSKAHPDAESLGQRWRIFKYIKTFTLCDMYDARNPCSSAIYTSEIYMTCMVRFGHISEQAGHLAVAQIKYASAKAAASGVSETSNTVVDTDISAAASALYECCECGVHTMGIPMSAYWSYRVARLLQFCQTWHLTNSYSVLGKLIGNDHDECGADELSDLVIGESIRALYVCAAADRWLVDSSPRSLAHMASDLVSDTPTGCSSSRCAGVDIGHRLEACAAAKTDCLDRSAASSAGCSTGGDMLCKIGAKTNTWLRWIYEMELNRLSKNGAPTGENRFRSVCDADAVARGSTCTHRHATARSCVDALRRIDESASAAALQRIVEQVSGDLYAVSEMSSAWQTSPHGVAADQTRDRASAKAEIGSSGDIGTVGRMEHDILACSDPRTAAASSVTWNPSVLVDALSKPTPRNVYRALAETASFLGFSIHWNAIPKQPTVGASPDVGWKEGDATDGITSDEVFWDAVVEVRVSDEASALGLQVQQAARARIIAYLMAQDGDVRDTGRRAIGETRNKLTMRQYETFMYVAETIVEEAMPSQAFKAVIEHMRFAMPCRRSAAARGAARGLLIGAESYGDCRAAVALGMLGAVLGTADVENVVPDPVVAPRRALLPAAAYRLFVSSLDILAKYMSQTASAGKMFDIGAKRTTTTTKTACDTFHIISAFRKYQSSTSGTGQGRGGCWCSAVLDRAARYLAAALRGGDRRAAAVFLMCESAGVRSSDAIASTNLIDGMRRLAASSPQSVRAACALAVQYGTLILVVLPIVLSPQLASLRGMSPLADHASYAQPERTPRWLLTSAAPTLIAHHRIVTTSNTPAAIPMRSIITIASSIADDIDGPIPVHIQRDIRPGYHKPRQPAAAFAEHRQHPLAASTDDTDAPK